MHCLEICLGCCVVKPLYGEISSNTDEKNIWKCRDKLVEYYIGNGKLCRKLYFLTKNLCSKNIDI